MGYFEGAMPFNPVFFLSIITMPELKPYFNWAFYLISVTYFTLSLLVIRFFPILDLFTTSAYIHYFVYLLYRIEHDPAINLGEMVLLEGFGNVFMQMLIDLDWLFGAACVVVTMMMGEIVSEHYWDEYEADVEAWIENLF